MTINSFFDGLTQNLLFGGIAAALLAFAMFTKANKVASTGSKAKMAGWALAPSLMVIVAVLAHGVALGIVYPRLQAAFTSAPAQNTLALADQLTALADNLLWNSGELPANLVGPAAFTVDAQPSQSAGAVTFASQPAPVPAMATPVIVTTNEQAVAAVNALAVKDDAQTYINTFIADNTPADAAVACGGAYTIKRGDSLAKIAKACYGDSNKWRLICNANSLRDCNNVRAGVVLVIPGGDNTALVQAQAPVSFGQQAATYQVVQPTPVYAAQPAQQAAAAPVRNQAGETVITSNEQAVAAIQAIAPTATPRPAYVLSEVLGKPSNNTGLDYINKFLAENGGNNTVAQAGQ